LNAVNKEYYYKDIQSTYNTDVQKGYRDVYDEEAIRQSLRNLFFITTGEVPGKPWFGNPLSLVVFEPMNYFQKNAVKQSFINVIERFEPRVEIDDVIIDIYPETNTIEVELKYYNLMYGKDELKSYRFDASYNNVSNIITRKVV
jgi:phage baseplate assembly protein W